jgi:peptide/nickel transport system substrate-binding protein
MPSEDRRVPHSARAPEPAASALVALALIVAACSPTPSRAPTIAPVPGVTTAPGSLVPASSGPTTGGTIHLLSWYEEMNHVDPQRIYTQEDLAFFGATIQRSLVSYASSPDPVDGTTLVPDMATDLGTATDGGRTWSFTLRDGVTWQDGSAVTCEDVKYGVSRTFANDVINQGPTYAVVYLDIPTNPVAVQGHEDDPRSQFLSAYYGPYDGTGQELFDRAVECSVDHRTITFHLKRPIADFNSATSLGFSPVPKAADTRETYGQPGHLVWSTGPYQVESYQPGKGGSMVLVRNTNWNPASDPIRHPYPDRWVIDFGIDEEAIDQRLIASVGDDAFAMDQLAMSPDYVAKVFDALGTAKPAFAGRALSGYDLYSRYYWINVRNVPNLKHRQAMQVALDRKAILAIAGGELFGTYADGVIQPTLGRDYENTGIWTDFYGHAIPDSGDSALARRLLAESGEKPPTLKFRIPDTVRNQQVLKIVQESLGKAGFTVEWYPDCEGYYYCAIQFNKADFGTAGWGADWPSASTVIPALFTMAGGWDLSNVDDPAFNAAVDDANAAVDDDAQALQWRALNRQVVENAWVIPTFYSRQQRLAGTKVAPVYLWPAYSSWPYRDMYVTP